MKTILGVLTMALLGAGASAAQPSDTSTMHDETSAADTPLDHGCDCVAATTCVAAATCEVKMKIATGRVEYALTCRQTDADHYTVEGDGYEQPQWASIEGSGEDMSALATAIERREAMRAKRCALGWHDPGPDGFARAIEGLIWSPRNSLVQTRVRVDRLDELVPILRSAVAAPYDDGDLGKWGDDGSSVPPDKGSA